MSIIIRQFPETLCEKCSEGQVTSFKDGTSFTICHEGVNPIQVRKPVSSCSRYTPKGQMTPYQAKEFGWVLEIKKSGQVGFKPPEK